MTTPKTYIIAASLQVATHEARERDIEPGSVAYITQPSQLQGAYVRPGERVIRITTGRELLAWLAAVDRQLAIIKTHQPDVVVEEVGLA